MEQNKILKFQSQDANFNKASREIGFALPQKAFFTLKDICNLKNLNYKTICNKKTTLQPNGGKADGKVGGRKVWRYETIANWISLTDAELVA